ncbi:hypothetical protein B0H67DRAFT_50106 [Lasiosphaeris hirsuta]|uniref:Uncharacterized protein n=1 Tax=Lasiosphaeris hirsuta TaxID=260670 RepID=A0AA40E8G3_9PEZI|nr:hypothetical protein B0H67DRAFT_50106 [Lasiosphaeris hirsuta]
MSCYVVWSRGRDKLVTPCLPDVERIASLSQGISRHPNEFARLTTTANSHAKQPLAPLRPHHPSVSRELDAQDDYHKRGYFHTSSILEDQG